MDIHAATTSFEAWLGKHCALNASDLDYKHRHMAKRKDPFPFFRGTYYRWAQLWPEICPRLNSAPRVLAVGDVHLENFGTWRDANGRLVWGVNDFDEAADLPYTNDLVRLAASVHFAKRAGPLDIKLGRASAAIERGYRKRLAKGGPPFVIEEHHAEVRAMALTKERDPKRFWRKLTAVLDDPQPHVPADLKRLTEATMPVRGVKLIWRFHPRVGMGSLGKPRFVALGEWEESWIAREAKMITPPASAWNAPSGHKEITRLRDIIEAAVRCPDPFYHIQSHWIIRRLAPRCSRIQLSQLPNKISQADLLEAMGSEIANIHLGSPEASGPILADLKKRKAEWLEAAANKMSTALEADWRKWRAGS